MSETPLAAATQALFHGVGLLRAAYGAGSSDESRIGALGVCESLTRQLEQVQIELMAGLERDGVFAARGYKSTSQAVADLLGCDAALTRRRMRVAEEISPRTSLNGQVLPARLPATAAVFAAGEVSLRHVEVIADALRTPTARRLEPDVWADAEAKLAEQARLYRPSELAVFAIDLLTALDQDGPEPDDDEPEQVNELHLSTRTGKIKGQLDGLTREALVAALDALCTPGGPEDQRTPAQRRADALGEIARQSLDSGELPTTGGERPHFTVIIPLEELERRARAAWLEFGSSLHPADLRMLACDCRIVPVVMNGAGQPLDIGRASRTIPDGLRRAIAARDCGCSFPGCGRPARWCDVHHLTAWEDGGVTAVHNCAMVCRFHHRLLHRASGWTVRIHNGLPEFTPPKWIDQTQTPLRRPPPPITHRR